MAHAQTIWNGPNTNFTQVNGNSDTILAGQVVLTRGGNQVLYNTAAGESSAGSASPLDTLWAFGSVNDFASLTYSTMEALRNGDLGSEIVGQPMVLQLVSEKIYISIEFSAWGEHGAGGFAYTRSTAPVAAPKPTVSITNPVGGATFTAPASVAIAASASVSSGTVTNVAFFAGTSLLGSAQTSPFKFTATGLAAGNYSLTAVATAAGASATSSVVSITVNPPAPTVSITNPVSGAVFSAPANVKLGATASVSAGFVTNVAFFGNTTLLGSVQSSPFNVASSGLAAGSYALTAIATAAGVSATSAVVNITVVSPAPVSNSVPQISNGAFSFSFSANAGLTYVVQDSSNLVNWLPLVTNIAASGSIQATDAFNPSSLRFYRVILRPNP